MGIAKVCMLYSYVCQHLSEGCVHACCVLELLMACHVQRKHTLLYDVHPAKGTHITDYDTQGYVFPHITMSFKRIAKVCML